jgi:hypothetical protein
MDILPFERFPERVRSNKDDPRLTSSVYCFDCTIADEPGLAILVLGSSGVNTP